MKKELVGTYRIVEFINRAGLRRFQPQVKRTSWLWKRIYGEWKDIGFWDSDGHLPTTYDTREEALESCADWDWRMHGKSVDVGVEVIKGRRDRK